MWPIIFILDTISHVSASSEGSTAPMIVRGPRGRPRVHPISDSGNDKWKEDDNVVDDFIFDHENTGINPDLFDTPLHGKFLFS